MQNGVHDEVPVMVRGEVETIDTFGVLPSDDGLPPLMFIRPTQLHRGRRRHRGAGPAVARAQERRGHHRRHARDDVDAAQLGHLPARAYRRRDDGGRGAGAGLGRLPGPRAPVHRLLPGARHAGALRQRLSLLRRAGRRHRASLASHAWAEAFVDDLGWVSFDPTNSRCATDTYVRLAVAFDYAGAAPIRGFRRGGGIEEMSVRLQVTQQRTQNQAQAQSQSHS